MKTVISVLSILSVVLLGACSSEDGGVTQQGTNTTRGTAKKGEKCSVDTDCSSPAARCHRDGICTGDLTSEAFETECTRDNYKTVCASYGCLLFGTNAQNKTGICTYSCSNDTDCNEGKCSPFTVKGQEVKYCISPCNDNSECSNGFVCVQNPNGPGKACLVESMTTAN
jgi:hypothetical protein